jgi:hypothetical protein
MEPRKTSGRQDADLARAGIVVVDAGNLVKNTFYPREIRKNHFSEDFPMQTQSIGYFPPSCTTQLATPHNNMKIFAQLLKNPAESRPVYTQREIEAQRAKMQEAIVNRAGKVQSALLAKINAAKAAGLSARDIQLTNDEVDQAIA